MSHKESWRAGPKSLRAVSTSVDREAVRSKLVVDQGVSAVEGKHVSFEKGGVSVRKVGGPHLSLTASCCVNGVVVSTVVDTGSMVTIVSPEIYEKLGEVPMLGKQIMKGAAGHKFEATKVGPVALKMGNVAIQTSIFVAPIKDHMLLGMDVLKALDVTIDVGKGEVRCNRVSEGSTFHPGKRDSSRVELGESVTISAGSEWVGPTVSVAPDRGPWVRFQPKKRMRQELVIAHAVYKAADDPIVSICNLGAEDVVLPKGTHLGTLYSVEWDDLVEGSVDNLKVDRVEVEGVEDLSFPGETPATPEWLPGFMEDLPSCLTEEERGKFSQLLCEYQDVFAKTDLDLGTFTAVEHKIDTGSAAPIKLGRRRSAIHFEKDESEMLEKMLRAKVIQPSTSSWAAVPVMVRKKDDSFRWCLDYRALNGVTKTDQFPLPRMEEATDALEGNVWFSHLDSNSAYWQVPVAEEDREKTAFRTKEGLFEFRRMPFGLCNSPATYSRALELVLRGLSWRIVLSYLDDVLVLGRTVQEHLDNLKEVFERFRKFGFKLKPKKCSFLKLETVFLGRVVNGKGTSLTKESVDLIQSWEAPRSVKEAQKFLGLANYHRQYIKGFAGLAAPLYELTQKPKKGSPKRPFCWTEEHQRAFQGLKDALTSPAVLAMPNSQDTFILETDSSGLGMGGQLLQRQQGEERVIAFGSFKLTPAMKRKCATHLELFALYRFTIHWDHFLLGKPFEARVDHASLVWLMNFKHLSGQLARWLEELSRFRFIIVHKPGKAHGAADALSRFPAHMKEDCPFYSRHVPLSELPCKGCEKCVAMEKQWGRFLDLYDDVQKLSKRNQACPDYAPELDVEVKWVEMEEPSVCTVSIFDESEVWKQTEQDFELRHLLRFLRTGKSPSQVECHLDPPACQHYWSHRQLFYLQEGKGIFFKTDKGADLLVIPRSLSDEVLHLCHDIPTAGHQGRARTKARLDKSYYWYQCGQQVGRYVRSCPKCQTAKKGRKGRFPQQTVHAGAPLEKVHIDFLGPLPVTSSGNSHILVVVDNFTKWVECFPLPDQEAETTAWACMNGFFIRFGFPTSLLSDQGQNFESKLFAEMCRVLDIHKKRTTAYRPSANGQAETQNSTLMAAVRCYVASCPEEWDKFVPLIASAMRSAVNENTGYSANFLMLGRELNTPSDCFLPPPEPVDQTAALSYPDKLVHSGF